jgi:hypothetical protein
MKPTLHVTVMVREGLRGRTAAAAVLRWGGAGPARTVVRYVKRRCDGTTTYRALLSALWEARRMGARRLVVGINDADVIAQISGNDVPPADVIGLYLQTRALLNAFRSAVVEYAPDEWPDLVAAPNAVAGSAPRPPVCSDLPLWTAVAT